MPTAFYAMLSRMKYIARWGLMRNTRQENLCEHTLEVAYLAHALALLRNRRQPGAVEPGAVVLAALYHDCSEILTGDLPTPIKYYNPEIKTAYKQIEAAANRKLLGMLPPELQPDYAPHFSPSAPVEELVKAADKLSALLKCLEEEQAGNQEFSKAKAATLEALRAMALPEVELFLQECLPAYRLTIDEL